jgi:two-component system, sensor histidine kinase
MTGFHKDHTAYLLSHLLSNLQTGVLLEDANRNVILINKRFAELFSIIEDPESLVGANCAELAVEFKNYIKNSEGLVDRVDELIRNKVNVFNDELELVNGTVLERNYTPMFIDEVHYGHLWTFNDITERKQQEARLKKQEEKYRSIIANLNLGLIEVDLNENIRYVNPSFCQMSGYEEQELIGKNASDLFLKPESKVAMRARNIQRQRGESEAYEMNVRTRFSNDSWWLICGTPLYDDRQQVIGSIGVHLDITEEKRLARQLMEAKLLAENSSQAKDQFLANMSHEIRTPMNAILGMSRQLQKTTLSTQQRSFLEIIGTAAENLLVIINDILDFSKLEAGKVNLESFGFNMYDLVHNSSRVLKLKAEEKGLVFTVIVAPEVAPVLLGDPYRINQVLMNLLSNAIKFTHRGSVTLECQLKHDQPAVQELEITISDTGKGMDETYLKSLFNKFSQEDESIARSYGGTGLGMSIVKQLVDLMNGVIEVESRKGVGTRVYVRLSFPKGTASDLPGKESLNVQEDILQHKKILLVEDNEMNRVVAETILTQYGATVIKAVNGVEAVKAVRQRTFDVVLMDIQMPLMDGFEATRTIRSELLSNVPIIALTANAVKGEMDKCLQAGMNDYLSKPFEEEDLLRLIVKWVHAEKESAKTKAVLSTTTALYSLDRLRQITRGDEKFMVKMLQVFVQETNASMNALEAALGENNAGQVKFMAHKMKSALGNLSIDSASEIARQIEKNEWQSQEQLTALVGELRNIMAAVLPMIIAEYSALL